MDKLQLNTKDIGKEFYFFPKVNSTNTWLKENHAHLGHGCTVAAGCQTEGRGRLGRQWEDAPGQGLYCSVLLKELSPRTLSLLPILAALAVCQSLFLLYGKMPQIKWPNDILLAGKKICGILCEAVPEESKLVAVCGIGVNLLQGKEYFEEKGLPYGGSLFTQTNLKKQPEELLPLLLQQLEKVLNQYQTQGFEKLRKEYCSQCINIGRNVEILRGEASRQGKALDIDEEGRLICLFGEDMEAVSSGEVSVRGIYGYAE